MILYRVKIIVVLCFAFSETQLIFADVFHLPVGQVSLDTVTVGDPGGGGVAYTYDIGKYEVTNAQYCEFLNAKATPPIYSNNRDYYGFYNSFMASDSNAGIAWSTTSSTYIVKPGYENKPVVYVSEIDAVRFTNWLTNGQGNGDTETGAYVFVHDPNGGWSMTSPGPAGHTSMANGNTIFWLLPYTNEWNKAAYYKGGSTNAGYWTYPTKSNTMPISEPTPGGSNSANYYTNSNGFALTHSKVYDGNQCYLADVGAYSSSPGPYGTFDLAGNAREPTDDMMFVRGGGWYDMNFYDRDLPPPSAEESSFMGFRVVRLGSVPEPASLAMVFVGAICLLAYAWILRR